MLLALVTALIVLRPLLGAEDPGQLSDFSDPGYMNLTFLALLGTAAWAGWRLVSRQPALYVGLLEAAFAVLVVVLFLTAGRASYARPAFLVAWEWLGLLLLLFLARQLAVRPEERQALVAVLMALVVALAAEAAYQSVWSLPRAAREATSSSDTGGEYGYVETWVREQAELRGLTASPLEVARLSRRVQQRQVHGPYLYPESLAAALALGLPVLLGAVVACVRSGALLWQTLLAALAAGLVAWMLVMTGDRAAVAAAAAVGLGSLCLAKARSPGRVLAAVGLGGALIGLLAATGYLDEPLGRCREVWPAAWRLAEDHFWRGLGPGQFGLYYPRYMAPTAGPKVTEPSNALLEVLASGGVVAGLALAAVFVLFFRAVFRGWPASAGARLESAAPPPSTSNEPAVLRWEYYVGGMLGLVLAFAFRAAALPGEDVISEAIAAAVRSVVWFAAFALLESVAWSDGEYAGALTAGVTCLLALLLVQGGIGFPSVAGLLWVAVALALAVVRPAPAEWLSRSPATDLLPVPAALALALSYFTFLYYPAASSASGTRDAQLAATLYHRAQDVPSDPPEPAAAPLVGMGAFHGLTRQAEGNRLFRAAIIQQQIVGPLERARREDPGDARLLVRLSDWYARAWALVARDVPPTLLPPDPQNGPGALAFDRAYRAREVNPEGPEGYLAEWERCRLVARDLQERAAALQRDAAAQEKGRRPSPDDLRREAALRITRARIRNAQAAKILETYLPRDPTDPRLHYLLAEALREAGADREKAARAQAEVARELDAQARPPRKLSEEERGKLARWLLGTESGR